MIREKPLGLEQDGQEGLAEIICMLATEIGKNVPDAFEISAGRFRISLCRLQDS